MQYLNNRLPIFVKFGMAMHIRPPIMTVNQKNFKISWSKMAVDDDLENKKSRYLRNCLADFDEILQDGAY